MMRRLLFGVLLALAARGARLEAQLGYQVQLFYDLHADTVLATRPGATFNVDVLSYDSYGWGVDSFALRMAFDATKLTFVSAQTQCPDSTPLNVSSGSGFVVISAPSCGGYYYYQGIARLTFQMQAGVTDGTIAGLRPLALIDNSGNNRQLDVTGDLVQICHASGIWGDIDDDALINSRDALIALSNAVGIPTGGFTISRGDVDNDGNVTSRDALAMLSASIGLSVNGFRIGGGIADACARQPLFGRPLYFDRNGQTPGVPGVSGLAIRFTGDSAVTVVGDSADAFLSFNWRPRVSPDGSSLLFVCMTANGYPAVCKANFDGSAKIALGDFNTDMSPDWSPAGDSIVFVRNNQIWVMATSGANPRAAGGLGVVTNVAWRPGTRQVAYTNTAGNGQVHVWDLDTGGDVTVFDAGTIFNAYTPRFVDWNAAGDSILFDLTLANGSAIVSVPAGGGPLQVRLALQGNAYYPAWTDLGVFFVTYWGGWYRIVLAKNDGTFAIISHDDQQHYVPGMKRQ